MTKPEGIQKHKLKMQVKKRLYQTIIQNYLTKLTKKCKEKLENKKL